MLSKKSKTFFYCGYKNEICQTHHRYMTKAPSFFVAAERLPTQCHFHTLGIIVVIFINGNKVTIIQISHAIANQPTTKAIASRARR